MLRAKASSFETLGALVSMLDNIARYNLPFDYVKQQEETIKTITLEQAKEIAKEIIKKNLNINEMIYVVVGDAKSQMKPLESLGLGKPVLVTR